MFYKRIKVNRLTANQCKVFSTLAISFLIIGCFIGLIQLPSTQATTVTFGKSTQGEASTEQSEGRVIYCKYSFTTTAVITSVSVYLGSDNSHLPTIQTAIYSDNSGYADQLLAYSVNWTMTAGFNGWHTFNLVNNVTLYKADSYYLVVWLSDYALLYFDSGSRNQAGYGNETYGCFPSTFWAGFSGLNWQLSIYASGSSLYPYSITASSDGNSVISPSGITQFSEDESQTYTYSAKVGYALASISVDGSPISLITHPNSYTFDNIRTDHNITVTSTNTTDITYGNATNMQYYIANKYYLFNFWHDIAYQGEWFLNLTRLDSNKLMIQNSRITLFYSNFTGSDLYANSAGYTGFSETVTPFTDNLGKGLSFNFTFYDNSSPPLSYLICVYSDKPYFTVKEAIILPSNCFVKIWDYFAVSTAHQSSFQVGSSYTSMFVYPYSSVNPLFFNLSSTTGNLMATLTPYEYTISTTDNEGFVTGMLNTNFTTFGYKWGYTSGVISVTLNAAVIQQGRTNSWIYSEPLYCEVTGNNTQQALSGYKLAISKSNDFYTQNQVLDTTSQGWSTWMSGVTTESGVIENSDWAAVNNKNIKLVQIDDGWERGYGNWIPNDNFPNGIAYIANKVHQNGQKLGLWFCPYLVPANMTGLHNWILGENWNQQIGGVTYWILDPADPDVNTYVGSVVQNFTRWGVDYIKVDYMGGNAWQDIFAYTGTKEAVSATRAINIGLQTIRDNAPNAHILECGLPFLPTTTAQSMRYTGDIEGFSGVATGDYSIMDAATTAAGLIPILGNNTVIQDQDYITDILYNGSIMSDQFFQSWLNFVEVSGSIQVIALNMPDYNSTRLQWISKVCNPASTGQQPIILDLNPHNTAAPSIWYQPATKFLSLFNWQSTSQSFTVNLTDLGLKPSIQYTNPYNRTMNQAIGIITANIPAYSSVSFFIEQQPNVAPSPTPSNSPNPTNNGGFSVRVEPTINPTVNPILIKITVNDLDLGKIQSNRTVIVPLKFYYSGSSLYLNSINLPAPFSNWYIQNGNFTTVVYPLNKSGLNSGTLNLVFNIGNLTEASYGGTFTIQCVDAFGAQHIAIARISAKNPAIQDGFDIGGFFLSISLCLLSLFAVFVIVLLALARKK